MGALAALGFTDNLLCDPASEHHWQVVPESKSKKRAAVRSLTGRSLDGQSGGRLEGNVGNEELKLVTVLEVPPNSKARHMSSKALEPLLHNGVAVEQASDVVFGSNYSK